MKNLKKFLSGLLALILVLGAIALFQPEASAADTPEAVTAYVTVSLKASDGTPSFAKARDGSDMTAKAVQVSDVDGDGFLRVYDLLVCAHEQLAPGGANDFAAVQDTKGNITAKKIWNSAEKFYILAGRQINLHKSVATNLRVNSVTITNGTHVYLTQNTKTDYLSNAAIKNGSDGNNLPGSQAYRITAVKGQSFTVGLYTVNFSTTNPMQNLVKGVNKKVFCKAVGSNADAVLVGTTDSKTGRLPAYTIEQPGDYLFYTEGANDLGPAACIVHVTDSKPVIDQISLGASEEQIAPLPDFDGSTFEYTITIPDDTTVLYGRAADSDASDNLRWCYQTSADGTAWTAGRNNYRFGAAEAAALQLGSASLLRIYTHDTQLAKTTDNLPLSEYYTINIKRQVQLSDLTVSGDTDASADFRTGRLDVYVAHDAQTATLTPTAASGVTIKLGETEVPSGEAQSVALTGEETTVTLTTHRDGEQYVDGTYIVTFRRAANQAAPIFRENPAPGLQEYVQDDNAAYLKPLTVLADANGTVSYQWYYNKTDSTKNGTKIDGATGRSYTPSVAEDAVGNRYYYCVASNGESSTASTTAHVYVYEAPFKSIELVTKIPQLPTDEDKVKLFDGHTEGFYYRKGDTAAPLELKVVLADWVEEKQEDGSLENFWYSWDRRGGNDRTVVPSFVPPTDIVYGGRTWIGFSVNLRFLGRYYTLSTYKDVYVYVDRAGNSYPSEVAFDGAGTKLSPWQLSNQGDLEQLRAYVSGGYDFADMYFCMTDNIALDETWKSIGEGEESGKGIGWTPFSGTLDGNGHTLTYAEDTDQPLFHRVREATVQNLAILAPHMKNYGLVSGYYVDYGDDGDYSLGTGGSYVAGTPDTIDIINVTIKEGSHIDKAGFIGGFASGANTVNIRNCTAEKGVTIGTSEATNVGSFGGLFNGTISDCVSYADVYGYGFVGGIVGQKGQSMGKYNITNCAFLGTVTATGKYAGGIAGGGYYAGSAPNTPGAVIQNCYVSGTITGTDCVGGIFGGEPSQLQAWNWSLIQDNTFYGTVTSTLENAAGVGGIIGSMASLNKNNFVENNYYVEGCGADKGIGTVRYLDTSFENPAHPEGCTVFDSSTGELPKRFGFSKRDMNRTDDPLGTDADKLAAKKTVTEFTDGTVVNLLNASESSWKNWTQGTSGPVHSRDPLFYKLEISGSYKTVYKPGETLNLTGIAFTAYRSDGVITHPALQEVRQLTAFDPQYLGEQTLTFQYGAAKATINVSVIKVYTDEDRANFGSVEVLFSLSDDAEFVTTDSAALANTPIKVTYFNLADYGLERYYRFNEKHELIEQPTILHLFITAMERYKLGLPESECGKGKLAQDKNFTKLLTATGSAGSLYLTSFWGHDQNLIYFYNGDYPLADAGWGATADQITLKDGDFVDVAMFSDWSFYSDDYSGFHYFSADGKTPQKTFCVTEGDELTLTYLLAHADMNGSPADYKPVEAETTVYYASSPDAAIAPSKLTDAKGVITLTFDTAGTYYLWTDGGANEKGAIVSSPACATVIVRTQAQIDQLKADEVEALINAIGEVTTDSGSRIDAARKAYDTLNDEQKALVGNYQTLLNAEARYRELTTPIIPVIPSKPSTPSKPDTGRKLPFTDVASGSWYYDGVMYAYEGGLMNGTSANAFSPNANTTRGMIVTVLARLDGVDTSGSSPWYAAGRTWAMNAGVSDGTNMDGKITREQLAAMLYRYAKSKGYDVSASADISAYTDASSVSGWATDAMRWAVGAGLINGRTATTLAPQGNATRAEVAAILMRFAQKIVK